MLFIQEAVFTKIRKFRIYHSLLSPIDFIIHVSLPYFSVLCDIYEN